MKVVAVLVFTAFAVASSSASEDRKVNDLAKVQNAAEMVFVEERRSPNNEFEWIPIGVPFKVGEAEKKVLEDLSKLEVGDPSAPLVGDLGQVALMDREGKVIAIVGVVELSAEFYIMEAKRKDNRFVDVEHGFFGFGESLELARWMYAALTDRWPDEMAMREQKWRAESPNDRSVDEQIALFKNRRQQGGADQPATDPVSKPEGGEKPQRESKPAPR